LKFAARNPEGQVEFYRGVFGAPFGPRRLKSHYPEVNYALHIMSVEQSGGIRSWDDDPFQRPPKYW